MYKSSNYAITGSSNFVSNAQVCLYKHELYQLYEVNFVLNIYKYV